MSKSMGPGDPLLDDPSLYLLTARLSQTARQDRELTSLSRAIWDQSLHPLQDVTG